MDVLEASVSSSATRRQSAKVGGPLGSLRSQLGSGRRFRPGRNHLVLVALIVVSCWTVLGFARTITQLNTATDRQERLLDETAALSAELDASRRELEVVQTEGFQALQARAYGIGAPSEIVFSLEPGAPPPKPVTPLGREGTEGAANTPLDAWLRLLFGD